jgi:uncharacterized phiE125 gp8 family phage protein
MRLKLITPATDKSLTVREVGDNLGLGSVTDHDARIEELIDSAEEEFFDYCNRPLMQSTWERYLDEFPYDTEPIYLPAPLGSVVSVKYKDPEGVERTMDSGLYVLDTVSAPARLLLASGAAWPGTCGDANDVVIRFVAGYANSAAVPRKIRNGLHLYIAHHFSNREPVQVGSIVTPINVWERCWDSARDWPV